MGNDVLLIAPDEKYDIMLGDHWNLFQYSDKYMYLSNGKMYISQKKLNLFFSEISVPSSLPIGIAYILDMT